MFTGLVEEIGRLRRIARVGNGAQLQIDCSVVRQGLKLGDSVAVDGVCLTVTALASDGFVVDVVAETLERTNLAARQTGAAVNLERALRAGDRLGGHFVLGHVDGLARVVSLWPEPQGYRARFSAPPSLSPLIAEKGSLALNGVSLTVAAVDGNVFEVALIPYTLEHTNLGELHVGDPVNLEVDVLARYVDRILATRERSAGSGITEERLRELGF